MEENKMLGAHGMGVGRTEVDTRPANQIKLDRIIDQNMQLLNYNKEQTTLLDNMLIELEKLNKNLAIVGQALLKMQDANDRIFACVAENRVEKPIKKAVDKAK
jgi:hypothetical protein